jgi:hypothetical protein
MKFINCLLLILLASAILNVNAFKRNKALLRRVANRGCNLWTGTVLPDAEIQNIIQAHNDYRNEVALGKATGASGAIPNASNMRQVYWSTAIAAKAQEWANNCKFSHSKPAFRKQGNMNVGENIYTKGSTKAVSPDHMSWKAGVTAWYHEIKKFNNDQIKPFKFTDGTGHFTQVVWAETYLIGCGYAAYKDGKWSKGLYVCEYGPAGNFMKHAMLVEGAPASACPDGTAVSTDYPGLCCISGNCTRDKIVAPSN